MTSEPGGLDYGPPPPPGIERRTFDVCIIGSGASGAVAAHALVDAGLDVLVIERGPFVDARARFADIVLASEPAYARHYSGCFAKIGNPWSSCNVGGGTVFYGGASFRYREVDFDAERFFPGADLPLRWPFGHAELGPYYEKVERLLGVAADPTHDPTAPPIASRGHYLPPVEPSRAGRALMAGARSLGLSPFPTPLAINTVAYRGRAACARETPCIEHACARGSKGDVQTAVLAPLAARSTGFTLLAGLEALRLERARRDRVHAVLTRHVVSGRAHRFRARAFVLACNAVQSAGLLLRSADRFDPSGIGNQHDVVGRGLCFKISDWVCGYLDGRAAEGSTHPNRGPFSTVSITDHYVDGSAPGGLGGLVYEAAYGHRYGLSETESVLRVEAILADQPAWENRVRLAPTRDERDVSDLVLDYTPHPRDRARLEHLVARCRALLAACGCTHVYRENKPAHLGSTHLHGGCRMGDDPRTSVVDPYGRVHGMDNLVVVDGGVMPFPGGVNPTLTIQACALRAARSLAGTLRSRSDGMRETRRTV